MRRLKQIGVARADGRAADPRGRKPTLAARMDRFKAGGIDDRQHDDRRLQRRHLGRAGRGRADRQRHRLDSRGRESRLPVIEYNFYANRLIEGYKEEAGRAGAGYTAYDYSCRRTCRPRTASARTCARISSKRAEHFLKAIVPEAEKANVRLALHPNDPPVPLSRGSQQIMATFEHWKEYLDLVKSPFNGMTFDCGVTREMGEDPVAVCRYLGERDCINHVHFRNVIVRTPTSTTPRCSSTMAGRHVRRDEASSCSRSTRGHLPRTSARDRHGP